MFLLFFKNRNIFFSFFIFFFIRFQEFQLSACFHFGTLSKNFLLHQIFLLIQNFNIKQQICKFYFIFLTFLFLAFILCQIIMQLAEFLTLFISFSYLFWIFYLIGHSLAILYLFYLIYYCKVLMYVFLMNKILFLIRVYEAF